MELRQSSLETYLLCGERFRRRFVEGEIIPPGIAAVKGTGVHRGAETNWRAKRESFEDLPKREIVEAAVAGFEGAVAEHGVCLSREEHSAGAAITLGQAKDQVAALAGLYAGEVAPEYQPVLIEQRWSLEFSPSVTLSGTLDLIDDRKRLVDLKTTGKAKKAAEAAHSRQLTIYSAAAKGLGITPTEVRLETLVSGRRPRRQLLRSTRGPEDFAAVAATVSAVAAAIEAGVFPPANPATNWACSERWCGYWSTCPYVNWSASATIVEITTPALGRAEGEREAKDSARSVSDCAPETLSPPAPSSGEEELPEEYLSVPL